MTSRSNKWTRIAAYLADEMNEKQKQKFLLELQDNQLLKNDYYLMKSTWKQYDATPDEKYQDTGLAWRFLMGKIQSDGMMIDEVNNRKHSGRLSFLRIAALILLVLAIGVPSLYFSLQDTSIFSSTIEYNSVNGVLTVDLPDGSRVFLNKGATLKYKKSFEEKRKVNLNGEGYFDVLSNPKRPFHVNTGKVVVTVLGTSFNVKQLDRNNSVEVFVESGLVELSMNDVSETIILEPGQLGMASDKLSRIVQKNENYLSWKTKEFKFVDESVEKILDVLKQSYHVKVVTENISLEERRLTTSYKDQSFDAILSTICLALNMDYEKEGEVYILQSK